MKSSIASSAFREHDERGSVLVGDAEGQRGIESLNNDPLEMGLEGTETTGAVGSSLTGKFLDWKGRRQREK